MFAAHAADGPRIAPVLAADDARIIAEVLVTGQSFCGEKPQDLCYGAPLPRGDVTFMATVDAIFEGGVFRPTSPVRLPEGTRVQLQTVVPMTLGPEAAQQHDPDGLLDEIYAVLSKVRPSGRTDTAARHDEHAA